MGTFKPAQSINKEIDVPLLTYKSLPIQVRYSLGGAFKDDKSKTRGMAIRIPDSEVDPYRNFAAYTDKIDISKSVANTPFL